MAVVRERWGCMDELLTNTPHNGCRLTWDSHEPRGVPADDLAAAFQPSTLTSGYIKSEKGFSLPQCGQSCSI